MKQQHSPVNVVFVMDGKSERPRIRVEIGTWYEIEIMPPEVFFKLCSEWWSNREIGS